MIVFVLFPVFVANFLVIVIGVINTQKYVKGQKVLYDIIKKVIDIYI